MSLVRGVDVLHWNPRERYGKGPISSKLPKMARLNNFGDLLGPLIVNRILDPASHLQTRITLHKKPRLLTVGSILHFAKVGDVVWGSGVNGKVQPSICQLSELDVRSVRGPLTANQFRKSGVLVPPVYGDPALLIPYLFPQVAQWSREKKRTVLAVPNLNDAAKWRGLHAEVLSPRSNVWDCIKRIAQSELVVASSLHALVIADSLGIPTVAVKSPNEPAFKYQDYYNGTDRDCPDLVSNVELALKTSPYQPKQAITALRVLDAFPWDLWDAGESI